MKLPLCQLFILCQQTIRRVIWFNYSNPLLYVLLVKQEDEEVKVSSEVTKDPLPLSNNTQKEIQEAPKKSSSSKKKNKKGGLSMFLSGALDDTPRESTPPPPPTPKSEGPAWGGVKLPKGSASLREIQDEQKKVQGFHINYSSNCKGKVGEIVDVNIEGRISLSSFISSNPIAVLSPNSSHAAADGEKSTPTWVAASGTPPSFSRPSLRDIQMQQVFFPLPLSST